ncbi:MAG: hypothetical protein UT34_C0002G0311 [candidate division WS6 bacterium GW2011_GWF2_39_15]|uniref:Uncharacterized protein n=1 Tax=candidate division WS6 bacterium GW2011_GWF2_39_15 TaxID=1619100 RepID=A0A0G0MP10_9BACT|nr:MAG: hypothetical protein UT34_C0002G0311 [candidate division WS6 bacterium GW2011_GWF2_39_15]
MYSSLEQDLKEIRMSDTVSDFYGRWNRNAKERHITPWGMIFKGSKLTSILSDFISGLQSVYDMENLSFSVAFGVMEAASFHHPYIRNVDGVLNAKRIYKVMAGSLICVREGEMKEYTPEGDFIVVENQDIFSFKAGAEGCVFAIFDFPAFDLKYDLNQIF